MTEQDREKWNSKYLQNTGNSDPSEILEKYIFLASRGKALDLACGNGRNSKFLAQKGLTPGGILIFESFIGEKKEYCLQPNELLHAFESFHVVFYEEKKSEHSDKFDQSVSLVAIKKV